MTEDDIIAEAARIVEAGQRRGLEVRLLGGAAIRLHAPSATHRALARAYRDIDLVAPARRSSEVELLLGGLGYQPDEQFNLLNGAHRLLFYDHGRSRQVDVFVGQFEMCHRLPLAERLHVEPLTLPLAELLLTKLQIVQLNEKDVRDVCALVLDHPLGDGDAETINMPRVAQLCAEDWGLWKTITVSIRKVQEFCDAYELDPQAKLTIVDRLALLRVALDAAPKSLRWRMRAAVGERVQWYDLPEEVGRG